MVTALLQANNLTAIAVTFHTKFLKQIRIIIASLTWLRGLYVSVILGASAPGRVPLGDPGERQDYEWFDVTSPRLGKLAPPGSRPG